MPHAPAISLRLAVLVLFTAVLYGLAWSGQGLDQVLPHAVFITLHTGLELVSCVVSLTVGLTALHVLDPRRRPQGRALAFGFVAVGVLDLLHTMSYGGMPDLVTPNGPQKSILFWLMARYTAALALLAWNCQDHRPSPRRSRALRLLMAAAVTAWGVGAALALLHPQGFPPLFEPGRGLTPLKHLLEGALVGLYLLAWALMRRRLARGSPAERIDEAPLHGALVLMVLAEGFLVLYSDRITDATNLLGHVYKVAAYVLLFRALFLNQVRRPFLRLERAHAELERRNAEYRDLTELAPSGVLVADENGRIRLCNRALEQMFGYAPGELVGQSMSRLLAPAFRERHRLGLQQAMKQPDEQLLHLASGLRGLCKDGREIDLEVSVGLGSRPGGRRLTAYVSDVSYRAEHQQAMEHRATHDLLTGLPNRWFLAERLERTLRETSPSGSLVGVLILGLDGFQRVNETHGTAAGDAVLCQVASRLAGCLGAQDTLARLGGDEFAVVATGCADPAQLQALGQRLQAALAPGLMLSDTEWTLGASVGLAVYPLHGRSAELLLQRADQALHESKREGRGRLTLYDERIGQRLHHELRLQTRLRAAIEQGRLQLHYQPQVAVDSGRVTGFEALLRWDDAELGAVSPADFIPLAERQGLIDAIGDQVLRMACRQLREWHEAGLPATLSINLSPLQFRRADLAQRIGAELARQRVDPAHLAIEITETAVMAEPDCAAAQLESLARLGVRVHLDDFGTGHSSLAWLKRFPISTIKIDRGFVRDMIVSRSDEAIVQAVIALAHSLGCTVVAEGVECPAQLARLRELGCDVYQGWLFSKALPAPQVLAMGWLSADAEAEPA